MKEVNKLADRKKRFSFKEQNHILQGLIAFALPQWRLFSLALVGMAVSAAIMAYLPVLVQRYIDDVLAPGLVSFELTIRICVFYFGLTLLQMVFAYLRELTFKLASEKTVADIRNRVYQRVVQLGMRYFDQTPNGTVVSRVTNDTETIKEFWNVFLTFAVGISNLISISIAMFALNYRLALVFLAFIPIMAILIVTYQKYSTIIYGRMREALGILNAKLSESISGMAIIQGFGQEQRMKAEFDEFNQQYMVARKAMFKMNAILLNPAVNLLQAIALVIVLYIFGVQHLNAVAIEIGVLYAFTSYTTSFFQPLVQMMDSLSVFQDGLVSGSRVLQLIELDELAPASHPDATGHITDGKIEIRNLTFSYDNKKQVLDDINVTAEPGQTIAFVGQTGSGKSSIINVLMRFYEFNQGEILIDGQSIRDIPVAELRRQMGLVLQDSFMFYGNIANNIRLHGEEYSDEAVAAAAKFVQADQFINSLDGGYQAKVIEGGAAFSSGQRQLLSFARTIIREPKILILDEATANIDTETEQQIQMGLNNMRRGRTTIIIAHRLSTIKDADKIYVLRKGQIIEAGNHDSLIADRGVYYDMYQLQSYGEQE